ARVEHSTSIIIAEALRCTGLTERLQDVQHLLHHRIEFLGNRESIQRRERARVQKEIERVHVVVERLLKINAVGPNLSSSLAHHDVPAYLLPPVRTHNLW